MLLLRAGNVQVMEELLRSLRLRMNPPCHPGFLDLQHRLLRELEAPIAQDWQQSRQLLQLQLLLLMRKWKSDCLVLHLE